MRLERRSVGMHMRMRIHGWALRPCATQIQGRARLRRSTWGSGAGTGQLSTVHSLKHLRTQFELRLLIAILSFYHSHFVTVVYLL